MGAAGAAATLIPAGAQAQEVDVDDDECEDAVGRPRGPVNRNPNSTGLTDSDRLIQVNRWVRTDEDNYGRGALRNSR